jgi:acyl-CoA reductase-like NAD-dependent aldehyde dehydrogenase
MPHWRASDTLACVEGTRGADAPPDLVEEPGELVVHKQHYRGFTDLLDVWLRNHGVTDVVIAGVYTHACVRETALDAYERGYRVAVASDAVASTEPAHAAETRRWLEARAAEFRTVRELLDGDSGAPAAGRAVVRHHDPCHSDRVLHEVPIGNADDVRTAVDTVAAVLAEWQECPPDTRAAALDAWADRLSAAADALRDAIVEEVAKPRAAAEDEVRRAIAHVRAAATLARALDHGPRALAPAVAVRSRPVGIVGILMPWNNPLALPVGKIAPALALANGVVFKPAPEGSATARAFLDELAGAGVPPELVGLVTGDASTGAAIADAPGIDALAITGSIAAGRAVAARCAATGKALQAELGGNNAAVVWDDDLAAHVPALVRAAYSYSGQRCTAIRRFVVHDARLDEFVALMADAIDALVVGEPADPATDLGPLISTGARDRVAAVVARARDAGAEFVRGGAVPRSLAHGSWYEPTLLVSRDREAEVVQDETFGPVVVVQPVADLDDAIAAANGVAQGLVMAVCSSDPRVRARVRDAAEVGIVQLGAGPVPVHPDAPFGGWKASGFGPPEHGEWDAWFATRLQAVYGDAEYGEAE